MGLRSVIGIVSEVRCDELSNLPLEFRPASERYYLVLVAALNSRLPLPDGKGLVSASPMSATPAAAPLLRQGPRLASPQSRDGGTAFSLETEPKYCRAETRGVCSSALLGSPDRARATLPLGSWETA